MSRTIVKIVVGALVGGVLGLLVGFLLPGVDNPFTYASIGIALGAGVSLAFGGGSN